MLHLKKSSVKSSHKPSPYNSPVFPSVKPKQKSIPIRLDDAGAGTGAPTVKTPLPVLSPQFKKSEKPNKFTFSKVVYRIASELKQKPDVNILTSASDWNMPTYSIFEKWFSICQSQNSLNATRAHDRAMQVLLSIYTKTEKQPTRQLQNLSPKDTEKIYKNLTIFINKYEHVLKCDGKYFNAVGMQSILKKYIH